MNKERVWRITGLEVLAIQALWQHPNAFEAAIKGGRRRRLDDPIPLHEYTIHG